MTALDLLGLAGTAAIAACFYFIRRRLELFMAACFAIVTACMAIGWSQSDPEAAGPTLLLSAGLLLNASGLGIVRIMLQRSVSLHLLAACSTEEAGPKATAEIAARLQDAEHLALVRRASEHGEYALTPCGRAIAGILTLVYRVARVEA